jgi:hypothetical protein
MIADFWTSVADLVQREVAVMTAACYRRPTGDLRDLLLKLTEY